MLRTTCIRLLAFFFIAGLCACQREAPTEKSSSPQPISAVDQAAQQAIDSIKTPMDKARAVEGTLEKSAESTAEKVKEAAQ
jgi:hypothetical protein